MEGVEHLGCLWNFGQGLEAAVIALVDLTLKTSTFFFVALRNEKLAGVIQDLEVVHTVACHMLHGCIFGLSTRVVDSFFLISLQKGMTLGDDIVKLQVRGLRIFQMHSMNGSRMMILNGFVRYASWRQRIVFVACALCFGVLST